MLPRIPLLIFLQLLFFGRSGTGASILYDGSLNTPPGLQGWLYATLPFNASVTQAVSAGRTILDSTARISDKAGYFRSITNPVMNRIVGFNLSFGLTLTREDHASTNRAGFSVIALSSDLKGIELGFWENSIWAQADTPLFTHAETALSEIANHSIQYDLQVKGTNYTLEADGVLLLTGPLRDYSSLGLPYTSSNFLFFGDDTTSASATIELGFISLEQLKPAVPSFSPAPAFESTGMRLLLTGDTNATFRLETSSNLVEWVALGTLLFTNSTIEFLDTDATNLQRRFYRAVAD